LVVRGIPGQRREHGIVHHLLLGGAELEALVWGELSFENRQSFVLLLRR
jgi:hypothetical protein